MKFSIIVPVYNSERYLPQCIESVLSQTHSSFELLLIDDESTDASSDICRHFEQIDSRVSYIWQNNAGTSAARNTGIEHASGEYLMFLDNDDYWSDSTALSDIDSLLSESHADVLMFDTNSFDEQTGEVKRSRKYLDRSQVMGREPGNALRAVLQSGLISRAVWSKAFKRSFIASNGIAFPEGMRNEDTDFSAQVFSLATSYDWYSKAFYWYRKNTGTSQTSQPLSKSSLDDLRTVLMRSVNRGQHLSGELQKSFYSYLVMPYAVWLGYSSANHLASPSEMREMKSLAFLFGFDYDSEMSQLISIYKIFGYRITCSLLGLWVKFFR